MSSCPELRLDWCSHEAAKYACEKWHYARRMLVGKTVKIGAWEAGSFVGCVIFGSGSSGVGNIGPSLALRSENVCELQRVALRQHSAPVSRIVSIGLRLLRTSFPALRLIVAYADPHEGHHGGIYQAMGWLYVGLSAATPVWMDRAGKLHHDRSVKPDGVRRGRYPARCARRDECVRMDRPGKHKYYLPLDDDMRRRVAPLARPYPKRAGSSASGTPAVQAGGGGATPTPALFNRE